MKSTRLRTPKTEWFLDLAERCAEQGTCLRRRYGAILVDDSNTIISTGYCGAPSKQQDCTEIGWCWREKHNIPSGQAYERCRSVHAEQNCIIQAGKMSRGTTLYMAGYEVKTNKIVDIAPCFLCAKMILNAGIKSVVGRTETGHRILDPIELYELRLKEALFHDDQI